MKFLLPNIFLSNIFCNIIFLCKLVFAFLSEYIFYKFGMKDYITFIDDLAFKLTKINILCVKLFQAVALNNNYIDEKTNKILIKYTDNAPYSYNDVNWSELIDCIKENDIKECNFIPINSGMISVVFHGSKDDKPVVLKVKRHNIENNIAYAIDRIKFCSMILSFIPLINSLEIPNVINKNIEIIREQTDFSKEVSNILLFKEKCKYMDYIKIPDVHQDITYKYKNIICMEYISGKNIKNVAPEDLNEFAKLVIKFGFASIFNFGLAHGDLHSGNIIFIKNKETNKYKLGIIDLGIVIHLDQDTKNSFIDIFSDITIEDTRSTAIKIINNLFEPKNILRKFKKEDKEIIIGIISSALKNILEKRTANHTLLYKNLKYLNDYFSKNDEIKKLGLKPNDEFVKLQLALAMSHGVTLELCKEKYIDLTNEVLDEMFHRHLLK